MVLWKFRVVRKYHEQDHVFGYIAMVKICILCCITSNISRNNLIAIILNENYFQTMKSKAQFWKQLDKFNAHVYSHFLQKQLFIQLCLNQNTWHCSKINLHFNIFVLPCIQTRKKVNRKHSIQIYWHRSLIKPL